MKLINILAVTTLLLFSIEGFARSIAPETVIKAHLTQVDIDPNTFFADNHNGDAHIEINKTRKTIRLIIPQRAPDCPPEMFCAMVMPKPQIIELPIKTRHFGHCGKVVYKAVADKTPVDGIKQSITVYDNSRNNCYQGNATNLTEVIYRDHNPWTGISTESFFYGSAFQDYYKTPAPFESAVK